MRPQGSGGKKSDSAITMRDNAGAGILIAIIISIEGNLHPFEEDHYTLKTDAEVLSRTSVVSKHYPSADCWYNLVFSFFPET